GRFKYQSTLRAVSQSLYHALAEFRVPLLLHAQVLVRLPGQGSRDFSGWLWNAGRAIRDSYFGPNREASQENPGGHLRARVLGQGSAPPNYGGRGHHFP